MEHRTYDDVVQSAGLCRLERLAVPMERDDRLRRWIQLLEAEPQRALRTLQGTEFRPCQERDVMRCDNSVMAVAFEDPVLRTEGLTGDTYGRCKAFFGLSDQQLHYVVCHCHGGAAMSAQTAADRLTMCLPRSTQAGILRGVFRHATSLWKTLRR